MIRSTGASPQARASEKTAGSGGCWAGSAAMVHQAQGGLLPMRRSFRATADKKKAQTKGEAAAGGSAPPDSSVTSSSANWTRVAGRGRCGSLMQGAGFGRGRGQGSGKHGILSRSSRCCTGAVTTVLQQHRGGWWDWFWLVDRVDRLRYPGRGAGGRRTLLQNAL